MAAPRCRPLAFALALALPAALALAPAPAGAQACPGGAICFDALASGSAASAADLGALSVLDALVLSEGDAALLLGVPTAGTFATSGDRGLLNSLQSEIVFRATGDDLRRFEADVLALFDAAGTAVGVLAEAYAGDTLVASDATDPALLGDSGFSEDVLLLELTSGFDRIVLRPDLDPGFATTFWLDTVRFQVVPEPSTALLLLSGMLGLAHRGRRPRETAARNAR